MKQTNKPSKGRSLRKAQKIKIALAVCEMYASDQYTIKECIRANGIQSEATWAKWVNEIKEIEEAYLKAQVDRERNYNAGLVSRALTGLERSLEGFPVELVEQEGEMIAGKDGQTVFSVKKIKRKQVYVRPSVPAIMYVLNNLKSGTFTGNPKPTPGADDRPTKLEIEIKGGRLPAVTAEDDIIDPTDRR